MTINDANSEALRAAYYEACLAVAKCLVNLSAATTMVLYAPTVDNIATMHRHRRLAILALDAYCEACAARDTPCGPLIEHAKIHAVQVEVGVFGVDKLLDLSEHYRVKVPTDYTPAPVKDPS